MNNWEKATEWEEEWWGNCVNTFGEETKQLLYAQKMGLTQVPNASTPFRFDLEGKYVLDIGGGPVSLLLKCERFKKAVVVDPLPMPRWVKERYKIAKIKLKEIKGEEIDLSERYDECFIYNVLQHTDNPAIIISKVKKVSKIIRVFEWINTSINNGHPHAFTEKQLNELFGGEGKTEKFTGQNTCWGTGWFGIFKGNLF